MNVNALPLVAVLAALCAPAFASFEDGVRLMTQKRYPEAVAALEREAKAHPGSPDVLLNLGWAYWHARRIDEAWKVGKTLVDLDSDNPSFLVFLANTDIERRDYRQAAALMRRVLRANPDRKDAQGVLARALFRLGKQAEALALLDRLIRRYPGEADLLYRKAGFLADMGRKSEALVLVGRLLAQSPSNADYRRLKARLLSEEGKTEEAKAEWKEVARNRPDAVSLLNLGYSYWKERNFDEAVKIGRILVKLDDNNPTFLRFMANMDIEKLDFEEALALAQKAVRVAPGDKDAWIILAKAQFRLQREKEAMAILDRLLAEHPDNASVRFHWAELAWRLGRRAQALPQLDALVKLDPTNASYRLNRAQALYDSGRYDEAIADWKILALAAEPSLPALRQLRDDAFNRQAWDEAVGWQERIIRITPDAPSWEKLSMIFTAMKDYSKAFLAASQAIETDRASINGYYLKAEALEKMELWKAAEQVYEEIGRRNPNSLRAQDGLSHVREAEGNLSGAVAAVHRVEKMQAPTVSPYLALQEARLSADRGRFGRAAALLKTLTERRRTVIPVLLYHGVSPSVRSDGIATALLRAQLAELQRRGYTAITVSELDRILRGKDQAPPKPLVLTFDDGRLDTFRNADSVLEALGLKATMFVHLSRLRKPGFHASPEEIRRWAETGRWEMQAHGFQAHDPTPLDGKGRLGHFLPNRMWLAKEGRLETPAEFRARVEGEYRKAKELLQAILPGKEIIAFAYPYGDYGQNDYTNNPEATSVNQEAVRRYFRLAFVQEQYGMNLLDANPTDLRRYEVPKTMTPRELASRLAVGDPWVQGKLLEAGFWTRAGQVGRAQEIYDLLKKEGVDEPQVWADNALADEKAGDVFEAERQFSMAIEPGVDNASNELYRKYLEQAKRNSAPLLGAEAQGFSDNHRNEVVKGIARAGANVASARLQAWAGAGHYDDRLNGSLPRIDVGEGGLQLGKVWGTKGSLQGAYGRREFSRGATGFADNYTVNGALQLSPAVRLAARDGMSNVDTASAIRAHRKFHTDGAGVTLDPALNWRLLADYDNSRYNDRNVENTLHAQVLKIFSDLLTVGAGYLYGDSKFVANEYYTPKALNQYTGIVGLHQAFGEKSALTGSRPLDATVQYEGGVGIENRRHDTVHSVRAALTWRIVDAVALTLDGQYSRSPTYLSRRADGGLAISFW